MYWPLSDQASDSQLHWTVAASSRVQSHYTQTVEQRTENRVLDSDRRPVFITERFGNWIPIFFGTQMNKWGDTCLVV